MIKTEAERIAAAVNILRPEWSTGLLMKVLGDTRMIRRPYADALIALVACATDPTTEKPGRVHEAGRWWSAVTAASPAAREIRKAEPGHCIICGDKWSLHGDTDAPGGHAYENPLDMSRGATPTPEQRAAIDAANADAKQAATAAREAVEKEREVGSVDEVLSRHQGDERRTA